MVMGRTGSGKTSLVNILLKLYAFQEGEIVFDKVNLKDISASELRQMIGVVPQQGLLITGTIRENIDPLNEYSDSEIEKVYQQLGISKEKKQKSVQI